MNTENFIAGLIDKYAQIPGYPFALWAGNVLQFNAVRAFFDELFKVAAGDAYSDYEDVIKPRMNADFSPYDVALPNKQKRVAFYPDLTSAGFLLATNFATDDYRADQIKFGECQTAAGSRLRVTSMKSGCPQFLKWSRFIPAPPSRR